MADYKKPDYWQIKARKEGYPARSVYKLQEMDEKFKLLRHSRQSGQAFRVLDLGAAPGSWSLYVLRKDPGVFLVSADIAPLSRQFGGGLFSGDNFKFIQGDITDAAIRDSILALGPYDLIISDVAPATMGNRFVDTSRSLELAEVVASYAEATLVEGGTLIVKVFQGGDVSELQKRLQGLFKTAKSFKPQACRRESFEMYYISREREPPNRG
jgi:23S rRNA (uridine2552-2'-O)-methyltransferase